VEDNRKRKYKRIVLIGMPCAGKSSIGRVLSQHYRLAFYDLDDEIEKYAGMSIENIFKTSGEAEFRKIETHVTEMMANTEDAVIATGGGIVTKPENMALLKREGSLVVYIHRDFYKLATTPRKVRDKRPVLREANFQELFDLYKRRLPLYKKYADVEVRNDNGREDSAARIVKVLDGILYETPDETALADTANAPSGVRSLVE
jgi:shikimate kinase